MAAAMAAKANGVMAAARQRMEAKTANGVASTAAAYGA
jgi:hypothetical protein